MSRKWILRIIFYFLLVSILIFIKTYDNYKTDLENNRHRIEHPLIKKTECINDVIKYKSIKSEHIDLSKVQVELKQLSARTIYAIEYSGSFKYDIYNTAQIGDSVIKKCNSDSLIVKQSNGSRFYFKLIDDWEKYN